MIFCVCQFGDTSHCPCFTRPKPFGPQLCNKIILSCTKSRNYYSGLPVEKNLAVNYLNKRAIGTF